ncbi:serine hydrolase [Roseobacter sp. HKCCA0434]|uniref:serine hydrolase domain-containing protein n=1 Tax=Roseobacter sp. HKCCA0434 TaxID=3079297 RepID=UPI0029058241|nr:serine hydrolase [Roseobacter sp. HKCCA0434]
MLTRRRFSGLLAAAPLAAPALAQDRFAALIAEVEALDQFRCLVVAQDGAEVLAHTVRGGGPDAPANIKSVSKSVVSALLGAAIAREVVPGVEATLAEVARDLIPADADPRVADITLEDLVTLRAGLERTSGANYGAWVSSPNWVADALGREMVADPGSRFLYSTGTTHVLGAALAEASGETLLTLARRWLAEPLGIEIPAWTRDPQGYYLGGNDMALTPRAMLAFGEMYRAGGGDVLPADWIEASWTPRTRSPFSRHQYGYGWFLAQARGHRVAYARGYGGQMIYVVPDLALTVAITSDPTRPARSGGYGGVLNRLLADTIIPAIA